MRWEDAVIRVESDAYATFVATRDFSPWPIAASQIVKQVAVIRVESDACATLVATRDFSPWPIAAPQMAMEVAVI